ncbi:MAG: site-2 protease family protein [Planctomycetota bacterium]|nr:site-2 protease family protein [Planctomycetota bacterium]
MLFEPKATSYDLRWRMLGIPVRVNPWFWLIGVFLGYYKGISLTELAVWIACVFASILLHEFGHALTARRFGARGVRVVLYQMGGLAIHEGGPTRKQRIVELCMGPGAGFILWAFLFAPEQLGWVRYDQLPRLAGLAARDLLHINLMWGLLNLIPVYPLDGGQILREALLLRGRPGANMRAMRLSMLFGILAALGFLGYGLVQKWDLRDILLPVVLFGAFAYYSYQLSKPEYQEAFETERPRDPWERDPDWWKQGGR